MAAPDWATVAEVQEFVPQGFDTTHLVRLLFPQNKQAWPVVLSPLLLPYNASPLLFPPCSNSMWIELQVVRLNVLFHV